MIVCIDLDGTASADPAFYAAETRGLMQAGHQVHFLTGNEHAARTLDGLGFRAGQNYTKVVTAPRHGIGRFKVAYMKAVGATQLIDNRKKTIRLVRKAGLTGHWHASPKPKGA